jgi:hypothetical protein
MGQGRDRLRIFENVMARVGLSGDFIGEYFKALSSLNGLQTYNELNPPQPPINPNLSTQGQNGAISAPISPEMGESTTSTGNPLQTP